MVEEAVRAAEDKAMRDHLETETDAEVERRERREEFIAQWSAMDRARKAAREPRPTNVTGSLQCSWCASAIPLAGKSPRWAAQLSERAAAGGPVFCSDECRSRNFRYQRDRQRYGPRRVGAL
jgi:hypothetical protein